MGVGGGLNVGSQRDNLGFKMRYSLTYIQGEWFLSAISNLILTERKYAINFDLKVDSDQGRLGI